jgi:hypothetical protein
VLEFIPAHLRLVDSDAGKTPGVLGELLILRIFSIPYVCHNMSMRYWKYHLLPHWDGNGTELTRREDHFSLTGAWCGRSLQDLFKDEV